MTDLQCLTFVLFLLCVTCAEYTVCTVCPVQNILYVQYCVPCAKYIYVLCAPCILYCMFCMTCFCAGNLSTQWYKEDVLVHKIPGLAERTQITKAAIISPRGRVSPFIEALDPAPSSGS